MRIDDRLKTLLEHARQGTSDWDLDAGADDGARDLLPAAVLVAVVPRGDGRGRLILTRRSVELRDHPGQIALPGGRIEPGDASPAAAALREAHEEIGLDPASVRIIGRLPAHRTVTAYKVTPVVAVVDGPFRPVPDPGEVEEIFDVPLAHVLDPANYRVESLHFGGRLRHYYAVPWGPYYIWGATARILHGMARGHGG